MITLLSQQTMSRIMILGIVEGFYIRLLPEPTFTLFSSHLETIIYSPEKLSTPFSKINGL